MKAPLLIGLTALTLMLDGCASPGKATLLGAGIGATAGAGVGLMAYPGRDGKYRARNVIIGGALGGLLGAGTGYVANELADKSNKEAYEKGKLDAQKGPGNYTPGTGKPVLIPPRVESRFVDDQVRGTTFVPAHVEYQITEPARWSR
jgi:hypothetical protein